MPKTVISRDRLLELKTSFQGGGVLVCLSPSVLAMVPEIKRTKSNWRITEDTRRKLRDETVAPTTGPAAQAFNEVAKASPPRFTPSAGTPTAAEADDRDAARANVWSKEKAAAPDARPPRPAAARSPLPEPIAVKKSPVPEPVVVVKKKKASSGVSPHSGFGASPSPSPPAEDTGFTVTAASTSPDKVKATTWNREPQSIASARAEAAQVAKSARVVVAAQQAAAVAPVVRPLGFADAPGLVMGARPTSLRPDSGVFAPGSGNGASFASQGTVFPSQMLRRGTPLTAAPAKSLATPTDGTPTTASLVPEETVSPSKGWGALPSRPAEDIFSGAGAGVHADPASNLAVSGRPRPPAMTVADAQTAKVQTAEDEGGDANTAPKLLSLSAGAAAWTPSVASAADAAVFGHVGSPYQPGVRRAILGDTGFLGLVHRNTQESWQQVRENAVRLPPTRHIHMLPAVGECFVSSRPTTVAMTQKTFNVFDRQHAPQNPDRIDDDDVATYFEEFQDLDAAHVKQPATASQRQGEGVAKRRERQVAEQKQSEAFQLWQQHVEHSDATQQWAHCAPPNARADVGDRIWDAQLRRWAEELRRFAEAHPHTIG
jgi:hypothetical protein